MSLRSVSIGDFWLFFSNRVNEFKKIRRRLVFFIKISFQIKFFIMRTFVTKMKIWKHPQKLLIYITRRNKVSNSIYSNIQLVKRKFLYILNYCWMIVNLFQIPDKKPYLNVRNFLQFGKIIAFLNKNISQANISKHKFFLKFVAFFKVGAFFKVNISNYVLFNSKTPTIVDLNHIKKCIKPFRTYLQHFGPCEWMTLKT